MKENRETLSQATAEKIFEEYRQRGRVDISRFPKEMLPEAFVYYREHLEEFDYKSRIEILEQFLMLNVPREEEARVFVAEMDETSKAVIGSYIGEVLRPGAYPGVFHECWEVFHLNEKQTFIDKFTTEHPEAVSVVAPFIPVAGYTGYKKEDGDPPTSFKRDPSFVRNGYRSRRFSKAEYPESIVKFHFNNVEDANELLNYCMSFPDEPGLSSLVDYFKHKNAIFLYPHIHSLIEKGVVDKKEAKEIFLGRRVFYFDTFFRSEEEDEEHARILEKAHMIRGDEEKEPLISIRSVSKGLNRESRLVFARTQKRALNYIFEDFDKYDSLLSKGGRMSVLEKFAGGDIPILTVADKLSLSKEEVRTLLAPGYMYAFDLSDIKKLIELDMEEEAVSSILRLIREASYSPGAESVMWNFKELLSWVSEENAQKILSTIDENAPHLLLKRLDYVAENRPEHFRELIESVIEDGEYFIGHYKNIENQIRLAEKEEKNLGISAEELKDALETTYKKDPGSIFKNASLFSEVFDPDQQREFIKNALESSAVDKNFLASCFYYIYAGKKSEADEAKEKRGGIDVLFQYTDELRDAIENNWDIVLEFDGYLWPVVTSVVPAESRFKALFEHEEKLFNLLSDFDYEIFEDFINHKRYLYKLRDMLVENEDVHVAASLLKKIKILLKENEKIKTEDDATTLSEQSKKILEETGDLFSDLIERKCEENPFLALEGVVYRLGDIVSTGDIIERFAEDYAALHPEFIPKLQPRIDEQAYAQIVEQNIRSVAFLVGRHNSPAVRKKFIPKEFREKVLEMNPLREIYATDVLEKDYYKTILEKLEEKPFFDIYREKLSDIAKEENEKYGDRLSTTGFRPDKDFTRITRRVLILNSFEKSLEAAKSLSRLPNQKIEKFAEIIEIALMAGIDESVEFDNALELVDVGEVERAQNMLSRHIVERLARICGLETLDIDSIDFRELNSEVMRVFSVYSTQIRESKGRRILGDVLKSAVEGRYELWRMWGEHADDDAEKGVLLEDLKNRSLLPKKIGLEQYQSWVGEDTANFEEVLAISELDMRSGIRKIFEEAVVDGHVSKDFFNFNPEEAKREYQMLYTPITRLSDRVKEIKEEFKRAKKEGGEVDPTLEEEYRGTKKRINDYMREHAESFDKAKAKLYLARLLQVTFEELENQALEILDNRVPLEKIFDKLEKTFAEEYEGFSQDIKRIRSTLYDIFDQVFGGEKVSSSKLHITDKVDLETYLKIGEEPVESCQHYKGGSMNEGLLAYITDPNVKIIQIWDDKKRIIARAVLRLMEDEEGRAQLFLERVYSTNVHHKIPESMTRFALKKSEKMGVGLYSLRSEGNAEFMDSTDTKTLSCGGSRSPYIYSDAGGGLCNGGVFRIKDAIKIA